jgi:glutamate-1-semialdehyde 2,1-aminomutase
MTAGRVAMELFDEKAVDDLNALTMKARNQIEEAIKLADVPVSLTGAGSMFRFHFRKNAPTKFRDTYQNTKEKELITDFLDYLFFEENLIMINTLACMFATSMVQKDIDKLTDGIFNAFKLLKPKFDNL